jgi:hypothetical protein
MIAELAARALSGTRLGEHRVGEHLAVGSWDAIGGVDHQSDANRCLTAPLCRLTMAFRL